MNKAGTAELSGAQVEQAIKLRVLRLLQAEGKKIDSDPVEFCNQTTVHWVIVPNPNAPTMSAMDPSTGPRDPSEMFVVAGAEIVWKE